MSRLDNFNALTNHPWFKKLCARMSKDDCTVAIKFILDNQNLTHGEFEIAVNRMFLDKEKPKNWKIILELLANSNKKEPQ